MPILKVEIALVGDAIAQDAPFELARMFAKAVDNFSTLSDPDWRQMNFFDSNGNNVGQCWIEEDE